MSRPFLITGLPRSRTAWLSVVASSDESICWHEPLGRLARWEDVFTQVWGVGAHRYVGISDLALGFHLPEILDRMPMPVLIVERPIDEIRFPAEIAGMGSEKTNFLPLLASALCYAHPMIMRVPFGALSANQVVAGCLRHLMPDCEVNMDRIKMMQRMNVQADMKHARRVAEGRVGDVAALLGTDVWALLRAM